MKKNVTLALAALLVVSSPLLPNRAFQSLFGQTPTTLVAAPLSADETIAKIRLNFENGDYDDFLSEMEKVYQEGQDSGSFEEFVALRGTDSSAATLAPLAKAFENQRSQALVDLLSVKDSSPLAEKIRSATRALPPSQEEALTKLGQLRHLGLNQGANSDENELIAIDAVSEFKLLELQKREGASADLKEKQAVLFMDRMHQMQTASEFFNDASLKKAVKESSLGLDAALAKNWDRTDLKEIAARANQNSSSLEQELQTVMQASDAKWSEVASSHVSNSNQ